MRFLKHQKFLHYAPTSTQKGTYHIIHTMIYQNDKLRKYEESISLEPLLSSPMQNFTLLSSSTHLVVQILRQFNRILLLLYPQNVITFHQTCARRRACGLHSAKLPEQAMPLQHCSCPLHFHLGQGLK